MTDPFADYRDSISTLILLMGENPLPNFVSALLLATKTSNVYIVHSDATEKEGKALERVLRREREYQNIFFVPVKESDRHNIHTTITSLARSLKGKVGLNYTGGTKAMAVHAYLALQSLQRSDPTWYSYLDPRTLSMWINGTGITTVKSIPVGTTIDVTLEEVLDLHDFLQEKVKKHMKTTVVWHAVINTLATIHSSSEQAKQWREWCQKILRRPDKPEDYRTTENMASMTTEDWRNWYNQRPHGIENFSRFQSDGRINQLTTDTFPFESIRECLSKEHPELQFPATFKQLANASNQKAGQSLAKWFDGTWLEQHVFQHISFLEQSHQINSIRMKINPDLEQTEFDFDVAFMRGYQLFALSCTTLSDEQDRGKVKNKLFEAVIRARQLGGSEARIGLVCCADDPSTLQNEICGVVRDTHIRVFGRRHLRTLRDEIAEWIEEASS